MCLDGHECVGNDGTLVSAFLVDLVLAATSTAGLQKLVVTATLSQVADLRLFQENIVL